MFPNKYIKNTLIVDSKVLYGNIYTLHQVDEYRLNQMFKTIEDSLKSGNIYTMR